MNGVHIHQNYEIRKIIHVLTFKILFVFQITVTLHKATDMDFAQL